MARAMGRISSGMSAGTAGTQAASSSRVMRVASPRFMPSTTGPRARAESRVPSQSGQTSSLRNFARRARPFSSFTFDSAFSTVYTALK